MLSADKPFFFGDSDEINFEPVLFLVGLTLDLIGRLLLCVSSTAPDVSWITGSSVSTVA